MPSSLTHLPQCVEGDGPRDLRLGKGAISIQARVSDHSNVNRGEHFDESVVNLAPDDGYAFDTFSSPLWKLKNVSASMTVTS